MGWGGLRAGAGRKPDRDQKRRTFAVEVYQLLGMGTRKALREVATRSLPSAVRERLRQGGEAASQSLASVFEALRKTRQAWLKRWAAAPPIPRADPATAAELDRLVSEQRASNGEPTLDPRRATFDTGWVPLRDAPEEHGVRSIWRHPAEPLWTDEEKGIDSPCTCPALILQCSAGFLASSRGVGVDELPALLGPRCQVADGCVWTLPPDGRQVPHRHCRFCNVAVEEGNPFVRMANVIHPVFERRRNYGWVCRNPECEVKLEALQRSDPPAWREED